MNFSPTTTAIRARIFNVLPAASYQMEKLFGLLDIEYSDITETACVECRDTPRLLLNREFVDAFCQDDGDLFLLILHELYHVILGHTRLFPRGDLIDNIAFDAVINSMLCRSVGKSVGVKLFTSTNSWENFPGRLLRPPPAWPWPADPSLSAEERRVIDLLYGDLEEAVTYHDIYQLLRKFLKEADNVLLLGNHGPEQRENPLLAGTVQRIVEGWPPPPVPIAGRDRGRTASAFWLNEEEKPGAAFTKAFKDLLGRCGIYCGSGPAHYRRGWVSRELVRESVLPDGRDRRISALRSITGKTPLFYRTLKTEKQLLPLRVPTVHLYLDVSGSMSGCLPYLSSACNQPFARGELKVYAFSTVVSELRGKNLGAAKLDNTGGTDINAVLEHFHGMPVARRPKVILIVTDGYVGQAQAKWLQRLGNLRTVAALTHSGYARDLEPWVNEIVLLPKP